VGLLVDAGLLADAHSRQKPNSPSAPFDDFQHWPFFLTGPPSYRSAEAGAAEIKAAIATVAAAMVKLRTDRPFFLDLTRRPPHRVSLILMILARLGRIIDGAENSGHILINDYGN
jgi:hypothetical protein